MDKERAMVIEDGQLFHSISVWIWAAPSVTYHLDGCWCGANKRFVCVSICVCAFCFVWTSMSVCISMHVCAIRNIYRRRSMLACSFYLSMYHQGPDCSGCVPSQGLNSKTTFEGQLCHSEKKKAVQIRGLLQMLPTNLAFFVWVQRTG